MQDKLISKLSKKLNKSHDELNESWEIAKQIAHNNLHTNEYDYIVGIFKKIIGENLTFKEFILLVEEGEGVPTNSTSSAIGSHEATDGNPKKKKVAKRKKLVDNGDSDNNEK